MDHGWQRLFGQSTASDHQDIIWSSVGTPVAGLGAERSWLTAHHLYFELGTLSTDSQQVPISAVLDVDVHQGRMQKSRGVYSVAVHIQRDSHVEIVNMVDIPDGREAQRIINETANAAKWLIKLGRAVGFVGWVSVATWLTRGGGAPAANSVLGGAGSG